MNKWWTNWRVENIIHEKIIMYLPLFCFIPKCFSHFCFLYPNIQSEVNSNKLTLTVFYFLLNLAVAFYKHFFICYQLTSLTAKMRKWEKSKWRHIFGLTARFSSNFWLLFKWVALFKAAVAEVSKVVINYTACQGMWPS